MREASQVDVLRIVNEPAASLAYGLGRKQKPQRPLLSMTWVEETFDISILRIEDGCSRC